MRVDGACGRRGWEYLKRLGHTPQVPRPSHAEADLEEQEAFKKVARTHKGGPRSPPGGGRRGVGSGPDASCLKPLLRRVWAPRGRRPVARIKRRCEWVYLYGFVRPRDGRTFWLILPTVSARTFSLALEQFARGIGAGEDKRILLMVDRAGWHTGGGVEVPEVIELEFLPARSPELQPAERLGPLVNECVANRLFEALDELEEALVERCLALSEQPQLVSSCTRYHWWPDAA